MRYWVLLLVSLLTLGCGDAAKGTDPHLLGGPLAPPSITSLTPSSVPANSVAFFMTVTGTNFGGDATVYWNGAPMFTRVVSSTQLLASVTDTDLMFVGLVPIYVRTEGVNSNTVDFNVSIQ